MKRIIKTTKWFSMKYGDSNKKIEKSHKSIIMVIKNIKIFIKKIKYEIL